MAMATMVALIMGAATTVAVGKLSEAPISGARQTSTARWMRNFAHPQLKLAATVIAAVAMLRERSDQEKQMRSAPDFSKVPGINKEVF